MSMRLSLLVAASLGSLSIAQAALAQTPSADPQAEPQEQTAETASGLDDIIVTATKRAQNLQDVPMSITAVTGELVEERGLETLDQVTRYTPNVRIAGADGPAKYISIRGLGSGNNRGFETSVGLFLDGVYLGREVFLFDAYIDLARIEAIKGPQGALFGKNTIAGAISVVSEDPTSDFSGNVGATIGENSKKVFSATVSGPLSDNLSARLTGEYFDRGGYIENTTTGEDDGRRRVGTVRGKLLWEPSEALTVKATAQYSKFDLNGTARQLGPSVPCVTIASAARCAPGFVSSPATLGGTRSLLDVARTVDPFAEDRPDFRRTAGPLPDGESRETLFSVLQGDLDVGDHTLTYIGSYSEIFNQQTDLDADATAINGGSLINGEDYRQQSHELRITSPRSGFLEYIAGVYYFSSEVRAFQNFLTPIGTVFGNVDQDTESVSLFAQATANISDQFRVIGGVRYIDEKKDASLRQVGVALLGFPSYTNAGTFRDKDVLLNGSVEYDLADDVMAYASFAQGYKAGGLNFFDFFNRTPTYNAESSDGFEVGIKSQLFDNRVRLNVALFTTKFDNLQVSFFNGTANVVGNAASARSKGIEAELTIQATEELQFNLSGAYLKARYITFPTAPCTIAQQLNTVGPCQQDLSGKALERAPDFSALASANYTVPLGSSGYRLGMNADLAYSSSYFTAGDLDPKSRQSGYPLLNGRIALDNPDQGWSIALVGRNLTKEVYTYVSANSFQFAGSRFVHVGDGRQIDLQLKYKW
jgi:iron complex outermembrane recepter protein